jgi:hypothetical protein
VVKRKWVLATVLLSLVLVTGCGTSTGKYKVAVAERDSLSSQLESVKTELANARVQLELTQTQLQTVNLQLESTRKSLAEAAYKADILQQKMDRAKIIGELAAVYAPYAKGLVPAPSESTKMGLEWTPKLTLLGDPQLTALFQSWIISNFAKQPTADLFDYVLGQALPRQLQ